MTTPDRPRRGDATPVVDAHVHFYDPGRPEGIDWPAENSPHYAARLPAHYNSDSPATACVAVETSRRPEDDAWLLRLAADNDTIAGIVLNLQPDLPAFERRLEKARECDRFVGIRLRPIGSYDWSSRLLLRNLGVLERYGKTVEFGAVDEALKSTLAQAADRFDGTTWILDHAGHPAGNLSDAGWRRAMSSLAERPNIVTKMTKLTEPTAEPAACVDFLLQTFGPDRLLYGSNWPLCSPNEFAIETLAVFTRAFGDNIDGVYAGNAKRVYGLSLPAEAQS